MPPIRYSPGERVVLKLLPRNGKRITSTELTRKYYGDRQPAFNGQKIVVGLISSLARKVEANKEQFKVMKSDRSGPIPMTIWIERHAVQNKG